MPRPSALAALPAAAAVLGLAALPAVSSAATIVPSAPCYATQFANSKLSYQPMTGTITGGTPGGRFQIFGVDGKAAGQVGNFDAAGNAQYTITSFSSAGINPSAGRTIELQVREFGAGGSPITGSTKVKVSTVAIDVANRPSSPRSKRVFRVSSTSYAGQKLYAFVVKGKSSRKVLKRISLGTANECGYVRKKTVTVPSRYQINKNYYIYVNPGKKLDKSKSPSIYRFSISRRFF
ncbi:hypothetical protein [Patulibacter sp.]|uniref:hypothetical protein n=1 Tax=Patulibacter sp. TaxID=1912859 RepID=UPI002721F44D|nr:hypothetical protein [Patulibacter sp.]MDO9406806.1 hypothetical protein [Patulibacter sp.]